MSSDRILKPNAGSSTVRSGFCGVAEAGPQALASSNGGRRDAPLEIRVQRAGQSLSGPWAARTDMPQGASEWPGGYFDLSHRSSPCSDPRPCA